jgi:hypothetical protein
MSYARYKLHNNYGDTESTWTEFCRVLEDSEVVAFGITDYFSLKNFFRCRERLEKEHLTSHKKLFPNLELRLTDVVNKDGERVELHIITKPDLRRAGRAAAFHFADPERTKGDIQLVPKPVPTGSDAHGMQELRDWLGRE